MNYRENTIWQHPHFNFCQLYQGTKVDVCMLEGKRSRMLEKSHLSFMFISSLSD